MFQAPTDNKLIPERAVWCAVLERAFYDMACRTQSGQAHRRRAQAFLLNNRQDFTLVGEMAGVEPGFVRKCARLMANGVVAMVVDGRGRKDIRVQ